MAEITSSNVKIVRHCSLEDSARRGTEQVARSCPGDVGNISNVQRTSLTRIPLGFSVHMARYNQIVIKLLPSRFTDFFSS